jgi:hypothetical protein
MSVSRVSKTATAPGFLSSKTDWENRMKTILATVTGSVFLKNWSFAATGPDQFYWKPQNWPVFNGLWNPEYVCARLWWVIVLAWMRNLVLAHFSTWPFYNVEAEMK